MLSNYVVGKYSSLSSNNSCLSGNNNMYLYTQVHIHMRVCLYARVLWPRPLAVASTCLPVTSGVARYTYIYICIQFVIKMYERKQTEFFSILLVLLLSSLIKFSTNIVPWTFLKIVPWKLRVFESSKCNHWYKKVENIPTVHGKYMGKYTHILRWNFQYF